MSFSYASNSPAARGPWLWFVGVGTLAKAAAELRIRQFAMSLLVRQMEEVLQVRLFDRTTRAADTCSPRIGSICGEHSLRARGLVHHMRDLTELKSTITFEGE
jgi:hypothetical protein